VNIRTVDPPLHTVVGIDIFRVQNGDGGHNDRFLKAFRSSYYAWLVDATG
jgi:hypothetical protein